MPELPEVETTVRELRKRIVGLKITDLWTDWPKITRHPKNIDEFKRRVRNRKIVAVQRRAKFIIIDIEGEESIFVHQKISGHLLYGAWKQHNGKWVSAVNGILKSDPKNQYIRLVLFLNNNNQLALSDLRRFGKIMLVHDNEINVIPAIAELGPEPLNLAYPQFAKLFRNKKGAVKQTLMNPVFIVGIGNIYADEILWDSGIHPLARIESLSNGDIRRIYRSMRKILAKAIRLKGTSDSDYRLPSGIKGSFQDATRAYHHTGEKCAKKDGGIITRMKIGGRSAHFCSVHQIK
ncbi:MAG: bifunctional DNA-formamidopyrimidine glycosylase/DNA-(apurinic or apyrimidinic site) lyase [Candidatus Yanofskybacteria bacterium]|nr:bifunctional DNA-formamidopyrimidine glycosylase/DNA-(apurinic or apyrimidinic site) lyase [Candidatus Yanofskybacteria bacterium]